MTELEASILALRSAKGSGEVSERAMRVAGRQASVALRKLLLDNSPALSPALEKPRFHRLQAPNNTRLEMNAEIEVKYQPCPRGPIVWDTKQETTVSHGSLPGWEKDGMLYQISTEIFATNEHPILKLDKWLKQPMIRIEEGEDEKTYMLGDLLRYVANTEGAHADTEERRGGQKHKEGGKLDRIGGASRGSYPQFIAIATACYLLNRVAIGIDLEPHWREWMTKGVIARQKARKVEITGMINPSWRTPIVCLEGVNLDTLAGNRPPLAQHPYRWAVESAVGTTSTKS